MEQSKLLVLINCLPLIIACIFVTQPITFRKSGDRPYGKTWAVSCQIFSFLCFGVWLLTEFSGLFTDSEGNKIVFGGIYFFTGTMVQLFRIKSRDLRY